MRVCRPDDANDYSRASERRAWNGRHQTRDSTTVTRAPLRQLATMQSITDTPNATRTIQLRAGVYLNGDLTLPGVPRGLAILVNGGGMSRQNPGMQHIARYAESAGLATLLLDLLPEAVRDVTHVLGHDRARDH
jgi:hypothetical protein